MFFKRYFRMWYWILDNDPTAGLNLSVNVFKRFC